MTSALLPEEFRAEVEVLWDYTQMHHEVRPVDVAVGLGSHDLGVASYAADLYRRGMFPLIVFTGAHGPFTVERFPRGEAVHFRELAIELGVPDRAILVEPRATNTGENIDFTRKLLEDVVGREIESVMLICRPYQQRRSYAICRKRWPAVDVVCSSRPLPLDQYIADIGDTDRVIISLVGEIQRLWVYPARDWAIRQQVPDDVRQAYSRLVDAGFTGRLLPG
ncbi:YdcF family protein [Nocardia sp. NPDC051030]|uniref:YdcF family protein n=1 Tax=Nocardia sp. NPDC051030 TaxID=3155162 RepID=UPI0034457ABD